MTTIARVLILVLGLAIHWGAAASMRITEWMYAGAGGEFVEFTNLGSVPVDMRGWSFDDDGRRIGQLDLSAFGVVQPGESVLITEASAEAFRSAWKVSTKIKIIGGYTNNLGRADEINLYDEAGYRVDRLTYGDNTIGGPRTQGVSGRPGTYEVIGTNTVSGWQLSVVGDSENSVQSQLGDIGSPGRTLFARRLVRLAGEPPPYVLRIDTDGAAPILDRENYLPGRFVLTDAKGRVMHDLRTEVRGRGNTTWGMPKKPYRVRLETSNELLDMPANRHWVLLANYADKTLLRNDLMLAMAARMGRTGWTPRSHHVELWLNGQYEGVYQLAEHIRIGTNRLNIPSLSAAQTTAPDITGGYLLEVDSRRGEDFCFDSTHTDMVFCAVDPDTLLAAAREPQRAYITGYIQALEDALYGPDFSNPETGYRAYLDVASAIDYYLINEVAKNVDGNLRVSTFLHKKRNDKLYFGPVWDFDITLGNVDFGIGEPFNPQGWYIQERWFERLFQDPAFVQQVVDRWLELREDGLHDWLQDRINSRATHLRQAQNRNFTRWPILGTYVWPNFVVTGSYEDELQYLRDWLAQRHAWMDNELAVNPVMPGTGTGLRGDYFTNPDLAGEPAWTAYHSPNASWPDNPGNGLGLDNWSARWQGEFEALSSGAYEIEVESDDRTRVWVNGVLIADDWGGPQPNQIYRTAPMHLVGGHRYPIVIEHADLTGPSEVRLRWRPPGSAVFRALPTTRAYGPPDGRQAASRGRGASANQRP